jgi:hypothetical protein
LVPWCQQPSPPTQHDYSLNQWAGSRAPSKYGTDASGDRFAPGLWGDVEVDVRLHDWRRHRAESEGGHLVGGQVTRLGEKMSRCAARPFGPHTITAVLRASSTAK